MLLIARKTMSNTCSLSRSRTTHRYTSTQTRSFSVFWWCGTRLDQQQFLNRASQHLTVMFSTDPRCLNLSLQWKMATLQAKTNFQVKGWGAQSNGTMKPRYTWNRISNQNIGCWLTSRHWMVKPIQRVKWHKPTTTSYSYKRSYCSKIFKVQPHAVVFDEEGVPKTVLIHRDTAALDLGEERLESGQLPGSPNKKCTRWSSSKQNASVWFGKVPTSPSENAIDRIEGYESNGRNRHNIFNWNGYGFEEDTLQPPENIPNYVITRNHKRVNRKQDNTKIFFLKKGAPSRSSVIH